ncbi:hypothetical protein Gpo141_00011265, partial [Globisporangium polare]
MQPRHEVLSEYDYSARVNLASSAVCGGAREPTVALKLHLTQEDSKSERQVMLELSEEQLAQLLDQFALITKAPRHAAQHRHRLYDVLVNPSVVSGWTFSGVTVTSTKT